MPKPKSMSEVVDELANRLLERISPTNDQQNPEVGIETQVQVFKEFVRWAAIKNKIDPGTEEGGKLDEYKRKLENRSSGGKGDSGDEDTSDGGGIAKSVITGKGKPGPAIPEPASGIAALIAKKPKHVIPSGAIDDSDDGDDGEDSGSEDDSPARTDMHILPGDTGDNGSDDPQVDSDGDI